MRPSPNREKTYVPLAEAAKLCGISESRIRQEALAGRVLLRAIDSRVHVDIDMLRGLWLPSGAALSAPTCILTKLIPKDILDRAEVVASEQA